jgi:hypothetical protein
MKKNAEPVVEGMRGIYSTDNAPIIHQSTQV